MSGSSARLKSSSNPRVWRDWKKIEWEDLRDQSSSRTKMRRSVGFSGENEWVRMGRSEIKEMKMMMERFAISSRVFSVEGLASPRSSSWVWLGALTDT